MTSIGPFKFLICAFLFTPCDQFGHFAGSGSGSPAPGSGNHDGRCGASARDSQTLVGPAGHGLDRPTRSRSTIELEEPDGAAEHRMPRGGAGWTKARTMTVTVAPATWPGPGGSSYPQIAPLERTAPCRQVHHTRRQPTHGVGTRRRACQCVQVCCHPSPSHGHVPPCLPVQCPTAQAELG